jgi:hypothetical protein
MPNYQTELTLEQDGVLTLTALPFRAGERVEIRIVARPQSTSEKTAPSLRGSVLWYDRPTDPVAEEHWEAPA